MRRALAPGVRRELRLGAVEKVDAPAATTVHVAGAVREVVQADWANAFVQRCRRCGRVLRTLTRRDLFALRGAGASTDARELVAVAGFFSEGRLIAEGPTCTYLLRDRPFAADEKECEFVPAFGWE